MSSFSRFTAKNQARSGSNASLNSNFIFKGYPSTTIHCGEKAISAVVVNQQEKDVAYIYTKTTDTLEVGSVWMAKTLPLLVSEEIIIIKDVQWKKYKALICNVNIGDLYGWYYGPEKRHVSVTLHQNAILTSDIKPVLVLPTGHITINDRIYISGRGFMVQEYDEISSPGIGYYSLVAATISKEELENNQGKNFFIVKEKQETITYPDEPARENEEGIIEILPYHPIAIGTEEGFFESSLSMLEVLSIKEKEVEFIVPFGAPDFSITVQEDGQLVTINCKVVQ